MSESELLNNSPKVKIIRILAKQITIILRVAWQLTDRNAKPIFLVLMKRLKKQQEECEEFAQLVNQV